MVCPESRVYTAQKREAAQHEAGANQQHHGERDLDHYQRLAQTSAAAGCAATSFLECVSEFNSRAPKRRHEAEYDAGCQRDGAGERQHAPVETNFARPWERIRTKRD